MSFFLNVLCFFCHIFFGYETPLPPSPSIVFIHIGDALPSYLEDAVTQARLFNPDLPIYIATNRCAATPRPDFFLENSIQWVALEELPLTPEHLEYQQSIILKDFWRFTSERFLYLYDLMCHMHLEDVIHLENDIMIYCDVSEFLPIFHAFYPGLGATFDNDNRCIAGLMYLSNAQSLQPLAQLFAEHAKRGPNDMDMIARYKNRSPITAIDHLPIVMPEYIKDYPLESDSGFTTASPERYCNHFDLFHSLFDAAAMGQFLGGFDLYRAPWSQPGYINESSLVNPSRFTIVWEQDEEQRLVPYALYGGSKYRINNLHIHSKQLHLFSSKSSKSHCTR